MVHGRGLGHSERIINCIPTIPEGFQNRPKEDTTNEAVHEEENKEVLGSLKQHLLIFY